MLKAVCHALISADIDFPPTNAGTTVEAQMGSGLNRGKLYPGQISFDAVLKTLPMLLLAKIPLELIVVTHSLAAWVLAGYVGAVFW